MAHLVEADAGPVSPSSRHLPVPGLQVEWWDALAGPMGAPAAHARRWQQTLLQRTRGISPELLAIALVYFVQGILGLSGLAISFFEKDTLQMTPAQMALASTICWIPWTIKPLYGFVSDSFPIGGMRRRPYLIIAGICGTLSWLALAGIAQTPVVAVFFMCLGGASTAVSDVVADSIVVELARAAPKGTDGSLQSLCWGMHACGSILTAYLSGWLVHKHGPRFVFMVTAMFPLIVCVASAFIKEKQLAVHGGLDAVSAGNGSPGKGARASDSAAQQRRRLLQNLRSFWQAIKQPGIWKPALFLYFWQGMPNAGSAFFYFKTNKLGFDAEFLGRVHLVAAIANLAGVLCYNTVLKRMRLRQLLLWGTLLATVLGLTPLMLVLGVNRRMGISDRVFSLVDTAVLTAIAQVLMMPTLVLSARICPEGVEATLFASLMSMLNAASATSDALGGLLTAAFGVTAHDFSHLVALLVVCNAAGALPLPLLGWVPAAADVGDREGQEHAGTSREDDGRETMPLKAAYDAEEQGTARAGDQEADAMAAAVEMSALLPQQHMSGLPLSQSASSWLNGQNGHSPRHRHD